MRQSQGVHQQSMPAKFILFLLLFLCPRGDGAVFDVTDERLKPVLFYVVSYGIRSFWKTICWAKWWQICMCFDLFLLLTRIHHRGLPWWPSGWESAYQWGGQGFDPWPRNLDPTCHRAISHVTTIEAELSRARDLQQEATAARNPCTTTRERPHSLQLKKAQVQRRTPSTANILIN